MNGVLGQTDPAAYLFVFIALSGLVCVAIAWMQMRKGCQARNWPKANAVITESYFCTSDPQNLYQRALRLVSFLSPPKHNIEVIYEFIHQDKLFRGFRVAIGQRATGNRKKIIDMFRTLQVGEVIEVSFNPANPRDSVIFTGPSESSIYLCVLGVIMAVVGCGLALLVFFA
jgi:hypothetical protein